GIRPRFAPREGHAFFGARGWRLRVFRSMPDEASRLRRETQALRLWRQAAVVWPTYLQRTFRELAGCVLLSARRDLCPSLVGDHADSPDSSLAGLIRCCPSAARSHPLAVPTGREGLVD